jgi:hypothetical protein
LMSNNELLTHEGNEVIEHGYYRSEQISLFWDNSYNTKSIAGIIWIFIAVININLLNGLKVMRKLKAVWSIVCNKNPNALQNKNGTPVWSTVFVYMLFEISFRIALLIAAFVNLHKFELFTTYYQSFLTYMSFVVNVTIRVCDGITVSVLALTVCYIVK